MRCIRQARSNAAFPHFPLQSVTKTDTSLSTYSPIEVLITSMMGFGKPMFKEFIRTKIIRTGYYLEGTDLFFRSYNFITSLSQKVIRARFFIVLVP